jgi:hypothetical protein
MQRGFLDAAALQELHQDLKQRNLQLPFPNPVPPLPVRLSFLDNSLRKEALQKILYIAPSSYMKIADTRANIESNGR